MTAGQFEPPQFSAVIAYDPAVVSPQTLKHALYVCSVNEFNAIEHPVENAQDMSGVLTKARTSLDLLIYLGDLPVRSIDPVCHTIELELDSRTPGVVNLARDVLMESGHTRALFEHIVAGWVGRTLVMTLTANSGALTETLIEILPAYAELMDPNPQPPKPRLTAAGSADGPVSENDTDTATILRMPKRSRD
ncbi:hypothetical protein QP868_01310 [Brevibacterium sp. UMB1308A]|uniref:hypothetical protein n=1 Tax=Brevibacterium sp. UMB1308A TaxID=3050608 RepID=UPI002550E34F|nr:hypothetical protein [Brevibacterium sp. UMB1308A]MDK8347370.1 hypothetical protein [Brevibacterium sp. UMB1308B]MDK8712534.1 hypothetical protein [Brevibacterium sp. UMB1308A]